MAAKALVLGAGGFIGAHLVKRLKGEGFWVRGVDLQHPEHAETHADEFLAGDLRDQAFVARVTDMAFDEVYQLAADMGGAGFIFTGENDADIMQNSALINLNVLDACRKQGIKRVFYSSSACIYPAHNQEDPDNPHCHEDSAYPANPDSEYGWEKLFSERLYFAYNRNYGMQCRVGRYHNIFGPECTWMGGREKVPAALCRKVAEAPQGGNIEVWGDGQQTRSFLYIDDCVEATVQHMRSDVEGPLNIGSEEMIAINDLARLIIDIAGKDLGIINVSGPLGVRGRNSDNRRIFAQLGWQPAYSLREGLARTYPWIAEQVRRHHNTLARSSA